MTEDQSAGAASSGTLAVELERLTGIIQASAAGSREKLTAAEHAGMVATAELAVATRTVYAMGDDPVVQAINNTPEQHQRAATGLAAALASHDGGQHANPFQDSRLATAYVSQQRFDAWLAQREQAQDDFRPAPLRVNRIDVDHGDRQNVQERAISEVTRDTEGFAARYKALPEAHNGRYVGADLAKELFDEYNQSREARTRYNGPVHNSASALAGQMYERAIHEHGTEGRDRAVFLTGSPGAGKTSMVIAQGKLDESVAVVFEGQMWQSQQSIPKVQAALDRGLKPEVIAVQPRPETALENTFNRFDHVGRGASIGVMAKIQGNLADGLRQLHAAFGDRVELRVIDARQAATTGHSTELKGWQHLNTLESEGNENDIKARLAAALERHRAAGTITDACYQQAAGNAPLRDQLTDRRMGVGHDPDAERIERRSHAPLSGEQARFLIQTTAERPGLRSDELARAHFIARQDKAWAESYDEEHGPDIARRSQRLAIQHGHVLARRLIQDDPTTGCTKYPELVNTHRSIAATGAHLREQGQPAKATEAVQEKLKLALADRLKHGLASPPVNIRQLEKQTSPPVAGGNEPQR